MTLDARNLNKAIQSTNLLIPRHEDIKTKLAGNEIFSKMDIRSAFWQIELHPDSRYLTVYHANDKLYMSIQTSDNRCETSTRRIEHYA